MRSDSLALSSGVPLTLRKHTADLPQKQKVNRHMTNQRSVAVCGEKLWRAPSPETDLTLGDGAETDRMQSREGGKRVDAEQRQS